MSDYSVCFWHNDIPECLELEQVQVQAQDSLTTSESVMQAVKDVDGFKTVICDKKRQCWLFKSNPERVQEGLLNLFASNYWDNPDIEMGTHYEYSSIYFVTPDGRNFIYDNGTVKYMGRGADLLFKRERASTELKKSLESWIGDEIENDQENNNAPIKKERFKQREAGTINANPFEFIHRTNIDPFQSIDSDKIPSSYEDIAMRYFAWSEGITDLGLKTCLENTNQTLSVDPIGYHINDYFYESRASYYVNKKLILIGPILINSLSDGTEKITNTVAHECSHHNFHTDRVADESTKLQFEVLNAMQFEIPKSDSSKPLAENLIKTAAIYAAEVSNDEIIAYVTGDKNTDTSRTLTRLNYIEDEYPPTTALYLFERLYETVHDNKYMEFGLKNELLEKIEGYIENARYRSEAGLKLTE